MQSGLNRSDMSRVSFWTMPLARYFCCGPSHEKNFLSQGSSQSSRAR
jgi:hypothetical protein